MVVDGARQKTRGMRSFTAFAASWSSAIVVAPSSCRVARPKYGFGTRMPQSSYRLCNDGRRYHLQAFIIVTNTSARASWIMKTFGNLPNRPGWPSNSRCFLALSACKYCWLNITSTQDQDQPIAQFLRVKMCRNKLRAFIASGHRPLAEPRVV